jgi:V/A-type H+-transporting ATPase subunit C
LGHGGGDGIASWEQEGSLTTYEKLADNYLISIREKSRPDFFWSRAVGSLSLGKENEIKLIRIVMVGKINGLPADDIKERLRDVYA